MQPLPSIVRVIATFFVAALGLNLISAQEPREEPRPRPDAPREPRGVAQPQPPGERGERREAPPREGDRRPEGGRFQPPAMGIDLTEAQRRAMREAWDSVREEMLDLGRKMTAARRELNEQIFDEKADAASLRKAAVKASEVEIEMVILRQRVFAKVRSSLKAEQIERLKQSPGGLFMLMPGAGMGGPEGRPGFQPPGEGQFRPRDGGGGGGGDRPPVEVRPLRDGEARPREGGEGRPPVRRPEAGRGEEPRPEIRRPAAGVDGERPREVRREGVAREGARAQAVLVSTVNGNTVVRVGDQQVFDGPTSGRVSAQSISREGAQFTAVWDGDRVIWESAKGAAQMIREGGLRRQEGDDRSRDPIRGPQRRPENDRDRR